MRIPVLRRLSAHEQGMVLLLVALFLPTLLVVAVAVDLSHILVGRQTLTNAADAAALAVATHTHLTDDEANTIAGAFIRATYPDPVTSFSVSNATTQVDIGITAQVPTFLLQVLDTQSVQITSARATANSASCLPYGGGRSRTSAFSGEPGCCAGCSARCGSSVSGESPVIGPTTFPAMLA